MFEQLRDPNRPPHIGVHLDNVPDYVLWLAAALSDSVLTGINSTYRGDQLGSPPTGQEKLTDRLVQVGLRTATTTTATSSSASASRPLRPVAGTTRSGSR